MVVRKTAIALALMLGWSGTAASGPALLFDTASGRVLYAEDQDQPWHPASLTKIMTAYVVFDALKSGAITLEQKIPVSANAHALPPSKLGLPVGAEITVNLALKAPGTKFIFAHIGGMNFRFWNILALARTAENLFADNVYFEISGPLHLAADAPIEAEFVWTLRNVGIDHVLLGSDYPQLGLAKAVDALERLDLSEDEKERIRSGTARKLFGP